MNHIKDPKVSVIILNWNGLKDTFECLESVRKIDYPNYDVIVIDNASTDGSPEKIERLFPEVILIKNKENIGYAAGNNVGINLALNNGSKYIWLLNNDTITPPDTLRGLVNSAEEMPQTGLISPVIYDYCSLNKIQFCGAYLDKMKVSIKYIGDIKNRDELIRKDVMLWGTALLINRDLVKRIGGLNEKYFAYYEDIDYSLRSLEENFINKMEFTTGVFHKCHGAETDKKNQSNYIFYITRNQYLFWRANLDISKRIFYLKNYVADKLRDVGRYRDSGNHELVNAILDGIYCAFRDRGGSRASSLHMPYLLKRLIVAHPFFYAYLLRPSFKIIVKEAIPGKTDPGYACSIIICTKDRPGEILRCIESISKQTYLPKEIIIVDSSKTLELEDRIKNSSHALSIRYIRATPGTTHQRNIGVKQASGDIVLFIDDDIVLEDDFIKSVAEVFKKYTGKRIGGVMGTIVNDPQCLTPFKVRLVRALFQMPDYGNGRFHLSGHATNPLGIRKIKKVEFLLSGITAYRKEVFKDFRFDEEYLNSYPLLEDNDFSFRVSRKYRNYYTPFARCCHYPSKINRLDPAAYRELFLKNSAYLFEKNIPKNIIRKTAFNLATFAIKNRIDQLPVSQIIALAMQNLLGKKITDISRNIFRKMKKGFNFLFIAK